jgi:hypothetical protein
MVKATACPKERSDLALQNLLAERTLATLYRTELISGRYGHGSCFDLEVIAHVGIALACAMTPPLLRGDQMPALAVPETG